MKILFIIPAYNEAENIEKTIKEIKSVTKHDILVINDMSKDNTEEIVRNLGIACITTVFNFGYSKAVQTGFKYALNNDYDYVVQFDADGQHIASEALKLIDFAITNETDIVIGSRFKEKTNYPHSFFRMIGTKLFSSIIYLTCHQKISDPTSGFQCLNRKTFQFYSRMNKYPEYPDANLIIEMLKMGFSIEEISTEMRIREFGISMHSGILKPIKYMILMTYNILLIILKTSTMKKKVI